MYDLDILYMIAARAKFPEDDGFRNGISRNSRPYTQGASSCSGNDGMLSSLWATVVYD